MEASLGFEFYASLEDAIGFVPVGGFDDHRLCTAFKLMRLASPRLARSSQRRSAPLP